jgi:hypothetical protein
LEISLDFLNGKIDQHTGDLGGHVLSSDLLNVFEDELSNLVSVVGVRLDDSGKEENTLLSVLLGKG